MRQTQKISGFVHSQAYVKAIACLVLACGGTLPTLAASEILSNPKVEEAQQSEITVKGTVVDDAGEPVIGATIMEKGTRNGMVTDIDGNYVIKVKRNAQLTISYLGYATQVVPAGTSKVVLKSNDTKLNEVVVVGFGTQKKVNLTGAVTAVSGEELDSRPVSNATQALQGMVAGLQITQAAGSLDDTPSLNVRGTTTIGQGSSGSPLVLIDGMEGDINTINPQDIASVSVLKDAAASSIYGSRAPFGVILITTKTGGKRDKVSVNYNNNFRFSTPIRMKHSMNSVDFACMQNDANTNIGGGQLFTPDHVQRMKDWIEGEYVNAGTRKDKNGNLIYSLDADANGYWLSGFTDGYASTDFYDAIYKKHTFSQEHNVSATGGDDKLNYYASFGYLGQDGLIKVADEGSSRYTATAKISSQWTNWMKFNYSLRFVRKDYHRPQSLGQGVYEYLGGQWPCVPLYDRNGNLYNEMVNTMTNGGTYRYQNDEYNHQVGLDIEPIKNWVTHAIFNYRTSHNESHTDMQHTYLYNLNGEAYDQNNFTYVGEDYYKENY
ncbi:SusC/RagA family TonB-linked outer membrane protein [Prevotella copri]|nr:SusC/RagA family TonB-linked outer membrane protein [Segatella copri]MCW4080686.1 SusC/RagA family TonB-linked outer membrane protein [Segatella copri]MCW4106023.1 SusC/RagA family TonB-linked outer membrane protein [Segatella copri]